MPIKCFREHDDNIRHIEHGAKDVATIGRSEDGRIKIGIFSSLASGFLPDLLRAYD